MIELFNIVFFATCWRILGGGWNDYTAKIPRWMPLVAGFVVLLVQAPDLWHLVAWVWLFYVLKIIPTNTLLSAIHGKYPARDDSKMWDWLQNASVYLDGLITDRTRSLSAYYSLGIIYGTLRFCLAIPAVIYIGNQWLAIFFGIGAIYYLAGRISQKHGVMISEMVLGAYLGFCLTYGG